MRRAILAASIAVVLASTGTARAENQATSKDTITLVGADEGGKLERDVAPGTAEVVLSFRASAALEGQFVVTDFAVDGRPPHTAKAVLRRTGGLPAAGDGRQLALPLAQAAVVDVTLAVADLRPNASYKGRVQVFAKNLAPRWDLVLKTVDFGVIGVDKPGTLKLVTLVPRWCRRADACPPPYARQFPIVLRDKSGEGPYANVRVRLEDVTAAKAAAIASNFTVDALSFWRDHGTEPVDLIGGRRTGAASLTIEQGSRGTTVWARAESLAAGEYTGVLRFTGDRASVQADDSKVAVTIQVRHHWWLAVLVTILGSIAGWWGKKYVEAYRAAWRLRAQARDLAARANFLARPEPPTSGWRFPDESSSYALARIRAILSQVMSLARSPLSLLANETELTDRLAGAQRRLAALETFRTARLKLQPAADGSPAAQTTIGGLLRRALNVLDGPGFGDPQRDEAAAILKEGDAWPDPAQRLTCLRGAVKRYGTYVDPLSGQIDALPPGDLRKLLVDSRDAWNAALATIDTCDAAELVVDERHVGRVLTLWRNRSRPWVNDLCAAAKAAPTGPLEDLFRIVDEKTWDFLKKDPKTLRITAPPGGVIVETQDLVEVGLTHADGLDEQIRRHPSLVEWRVEPPEGNARTLTSDDLRVVQYFPRAGLATIRAKLVWRGDEIVVPEPRALEVVINSDFRAWRAFELVELGVTALAVVFAILTAMNTVYDSTFGSFGQYLTLIIWAAGVSIGGNLFKQMGTTRTVGGQEAALPARAP
jgi:hypothetical protein